MRIKKIQIKNFKSLVDFELEDLKAFCAFVGPNASGKSNIFEALEFTNYVATYGFKAMNFFNLNDIVSFNFRPISKFKEADDPTFIINYDFESNLPLNSSFYTYKKEQSNEYEIKGVASPFVDNFNGPHYRPFLILDASDFEKRKEFTVRWKERGNTYDQELEQFIDNFSRLFVGKSNLNRTPTIAGKLAPDASNLSQIVGKVFEDENVRIDFIDWLRILIPEFENIEVKKSNIDRSFEFFLYEKSSNKPFPKNLISDGTYNILALMTAVYQNNQPQFLCIEEPENGLHPQAIQLLVDFFREKCEEKDHHIWLNTHSQTLVRCLEIDEIILVNKVDGETRAKQLTKEANIDIKTDEAWLSNALGGGVLWSK